MIEIRNAEQNKAFHAMLRDIAKQVQWAGGFMDEEDWKRIMLAGKFGQRVVPNPLGHGFIVQNNKRSSHLTHEEMQEFLGEIEAFGAENGVDWSDDDVPESEAA